MENSQVTFRGITRQLPYQNNPDGVCDEVINLRMHKGRLEPVGTKQKVYSLPTDGTVYNRMWIHEMDTVTKWVGQDNGNNFRLFNPSDGSSSVIKAYSGEVKVEFMKRFMVVVHDGGNDVFVWDSSLSAYSLVSRAPVPFLSLETINNEHIVPEYIAGIPEFLGRYFEAVNRASNEDGKLTGAFSWRVALRMYDGTYVMHTTPRVHTIFTAIRMYEKQAEGGGQLNDPRALLFDVANVRATITPATFAGINTNIFTDVVLFFSKATPAYDISEDTITEQALIDASITGDGSYPLSKVTTKLDDDFINLPDCGSWYNVFEISTKEILEHTEAFTEDIDTTDFYQDYATREVLPVDQFSHHQVAGRVTLNYNSRLVIGATSTQFGQYAQGLKTSHSRGTLELRTIVCVWTIKDSAEEFRVVTTMYNQPVYLSSPVYYFFFPEIIAYPDARAKHMTAYCMNGSDYILLSDFDLKKSKTGNFAYYDVSETLSVDGQNYQLIEKTLNSFVPASVSLESENTMLDSNRVQISEVNNPFFFPAKNSYQVGTGDITDIAANTEPLSTGQFGEYPLVIFTTKGIWGLLQGSGDVLFSSVLPVSGEVSNRGAISIGDGIIFTTERGIYLMQGKQITELSTLVTGSPNADFQTNANYNFYINDIRLTTLLPFLSTSDIIDYLQDAQLGFDKIRKELYITNSNESYSYIYNFESDFWYKLPESFRILINYYPKLFCFRESGSNQGIINLSSETYNDYVDVLLTTQPMKFGADSFKVIHRMILRTIHETPDSKYSGFYYFGSSDLINWQRITGRNHISGKKRDILLQRSGSKFKYFIVVFSANMKQGGYISTLDVQFQTKMGLKLR